MPSLTHTETLSCTLALSHMSGLFPVPSQLYLIVPSLSCTWFCSFTRLLLFSWPHSLCCTLRPFLMPLLPFLRLHGHSLSCPHAHFLALFLQLSQELSFSQVFTFYIVHTCHILMRTLSHKLSYSFLCFLSFSHPVLWPCSLSYTMSPILMTSSPFSQPHSHCFSCPHTHFLAHTFFFSHNLSFVSHLCLTHTLSALFT